MTQAAIDFAPAPATLANARAQRDAGIARTRKATDRRNPTWADVAYQYLERYARHHQLFTPEAVTDEAESWGLTAPSDKRAWGFIYLKAQRAGIIERSTEIYQRRFGHGSVGVKWRSKIFREPRDA